MQFKLSAKSIGKILIFVLILCFLVPLRLSLHVRIPTEEVNTIRIERTRYDHTDGFIEDFIVLSNETSVNELLSNLKKLPATPSLRTIFEKRSFNSRGEHTSYTIRIFSHAKPYYYHFDINSRYLKDWNKAVIFKHHSNLNFLQEAFNKHKNYNFDALSLKFTPSIRSSLDSYRLIQSSVPGFPLTLDLCEEDQDKGLVYYWSTSKGNLIDWVDSNIVPVESNSPTKLKTIYWVPSSEDETAVPDEDYNATVSVTIRHEESGLYLSTVSLQIKLTEEGTYILVQE